MRQRATPGHREEPSRKREKGTEPPTNNCGKAERMRESKLTERASKDKVHQAHAGREQAMRYKYRARGGHKESKGRKQ